MMKQITLDMGTSSTRLRLYDGMTLLGQQKRSFGIRDVRTGGVVALKTVLRNGILALLAATKTDFSDVDKILASGMITSGNGLCEVPHTEAPVTAQMLAERAVRVVYPEIVSIPFYLIPGVKNAGGFAADGFDIMRGEETETFGLLHRCGLRGPCLLVLPGSHTKLVFVNEENKIMWCRTTVGGELFRAVAEQTILASSLPSPMPKAYDMTYVKMGYEAALRQGMSAAVFRVRLSDLFSDESADQRASYLVGAVFAEEIRLIASYADGVLVLVGGSDPLRSVFSSLLRLYGVRDVRTACDEDSDMASGIGALLVGGEIR